MSTPTKPVSSGEPQRPPKAGANSVEGKNIDKIRDILFGSQSRQIEKKLAALDDRIEKGIVALRRETNSSLNALEQYVRKALDALSDQFKLEKDERIDSVKELSEKVGDAQKNVDSRLSLLKAKVITHQRETQEQILEQVKTLMAEIREQNDSLRNHVDHSIAALTSEKTDRLALADLMMEAAIRLKNEFPLPDSEEGESVDQSAHQ